MLFFFCMLYFILLHFQTFFIVPNIFLHFTHIYANSVNFLLTWKWLKIGPNVVFYLWFFTVLSFKKPLLTRCLKMCSSFFPLFCVCMWSCKYLKSSFKPPLSNKLPLFRSWKLISPSLPSPLLLFTNKW